MMPSKRDSENRSEEKMFLCEYEGQRTVAPDSDVELWNEGLDGEFTVVRDLGTIVHAWEVTGSGSIPRAEQYVTDERNLITASAEPRTSRSRVESDVDVSVDVPTTLFDGRHVAAAAKSADRDALPAEDRKQLEANPSEIATLINENVADRLQARYDTWRNEQSTYPRGRDYGYDVPLERDWKRRVLSEHTPLTDRQAAVIADFGYPFLMRVRVLVE